MASARVVCQVPAEAPIDIVIYYDEHLKLLEKALDKHGLRLIGPAPENISGGDLPLYTVSPKSP